MPDFTKIQSLLRSPYKRDTWESLLLSLFPESSLTLFQTPQPLQATHEKVTSTLQLGTLTLPGDDQSIAILEVTTTSQIELARNRVGLRNYVASFIDQANASGVLAVFQQPSSPDWRLTYAARSTTLDQDTFQITTVETAPRRYTFLLGKNEPCRTAAARLVQLREKSEKGEDLSLKDLELAFSVESLTKDFFKKYKEEYQTFIDHLLSPDLAEETRKLFNIPSLDNDAAQEKADKPVRDFVKTLLGRLVFLTFLQKKGWLGCPAGTKVWKNGQEDFLQSFLKLATENQEADLFHSKYLTSLFFEALNQEEREGDLFSLTGTRLPYLNGGLFEDDDDHARSINFPPQLFVNLLNFFDEYNFTIDENDPEDHEVGIDPEMLGMIFENLLEDNKEKGTYYTPKAIVSYMARQSLLHYLQTHLGENEALQTLLNEKNSEALPEFIEENKTRIIELLEKVTICDPAIGSGAFPIGLLHEILWTRLTLEDSQKNTPKFRAQLKRAIIQNSIHGVDLDPGAIEIARLRFWLALVVDEDKPRPLPNLDYKIHRADSLIEYIRGEPVNHGTELPASPTMRAAIDHLIQAKKDLFVAQGLPGKRKAWFALYRALALVGQTEFTTLRNEEGLFTTGERVAQLDQNAHAFGQWITKIDTIQKQKVHHQETLLAELRQWFDDEKHPTFLWNLHFSGIFSNGGFDIVIANPPYVRHETISDYAPLLKERYDVAASRADLLIFFYEQAVNLTKKCGIVTFITSNKFYRAAYGKKLRPFLSKKLQLKTLIDFGDTPVFDAIAYASILIGRKAKPPTDHSTVTYNWELSDSVHRITKVIEERAFTLDQTRLGTGGWQLEPPAVVELLAKLRETGTPLTDYVDGQFFYGIKTGFNEAFVLSDQDRKRLIKQDPRSEELIKPFLRGKDVKRWKVTNNDLYIIAFPHGFHSQLENYPAISEHLHKYEEKLKNRGQCKTSRGKKEGGQHHWLELDNNPKEEYLKLFSEPKILYPDIYKHQSFCYDSSGKFSTNTTYFIAKDDKSLCSILNSLTVEWFYSNTSNRIRGGYLRSFSNYIKQIPIPPATDAEKTELAALAEKCAAAAAKDDQATLAIHEAEINQIVYRLFDLTPEEITLIESSLNS